MYTVAVTSADQGSVPGKSRVLVLFWHQGGTGGHEAPPSYHMVEMALDHGCLACGVPESMEPDRLFSVRLSSLTGLSSEASNMNYMIDLTGAAQLNIN